MTCRLIRQDAERQTVYDDERPVGDVREHPLSLGECCTIRCRIGAGQTHDADRPSARTQASDDLAIVSIPAGSGAEITGNHEPEISRHRRDVVTGPSYAAQATCDSWSVILSDAMPRACSPSSPSEIAAQTRSKITRARNSVVVLRPANAAS